MSAKHALVIGGGFAGLLAAKVLARYTDRVTVVERDVHPTGPQPRKGVPQARHSHLLMGPGARAVDALVPGTLQAWTDAGAHRLSATGEVAFLTKFGWLPRCTHSEFIVSCSRDLLDWVVRERVLRDERISVRTETEVTGLIGDGSRVTGALVRDRGTGEQSRVEAEFVVAAAGRSARAADWLTDLGLPPVEEEVIDAGTAYATRLYQPSAELHAATPGIVMIANSTGEATGGALLPLEDGRWTVTMIGMRGSEPPVEADEFTRFAEQLSEPAIAKLLTEATPLGAARGFRGLVNRRWRFDRLPKHPENLVVLGDAACTLNPSHAHGLTVAALGIQAFDTVLAQHGFAPGAALRAQRAVAAQARDAWDLSISDDLRHPSVRGAVPNLALRLQNVYADRVMRAATGRTTVARSLVDVMALARTPISLAAPATLLAALRGPGSRPARAEAAPALAPRL
ncbi:FAD-dependent monooxygenase [Kitasatospora sp. NPDC048286]|uniref:FAD-dependent monooxygenase n=1 Tax=Kitasatospora sp. NPDC048286 TaxID=3364047 RepID=UPI0037233F87